MRCGDWQRARGSPLLRLTEHADPHATGIVMCAQSRSRRWGKINHRLRNFCSASFARSAAGAVRAVVMRDPKDVWPLASRVSPLHIWQRKKVLRTVHALLSHQSMPHYSPSCKYIQLPRQKSPAKRARDGIEWTLRVPARPSRHPSVCARAESMIFRCFFVWPYKSSIPGRLLRLSLPCTPIRTLISSHLPDKELSSAPISTLQTSSELLTPSVDLLTSHLT